MSDPKPLTEIVGAAVDQARADRHSDPTPVPLDEIKQRKAWFDQCDDAMRVLLSPAERDALCEALRIAVEGLEKIPVHANDPANSAAEAAYRCRCEAGVTLAAVRELVDLGEKP